MIFKNHRKVLIQTKIIKIDPNLQRIRSGELDRELSTQFEEMKNEQKEHLARLQADFAPKSTDNESDESDSK